MSSPDFSTRGPHNYPLRFAVRRAGPRGLKICGSDYKQPIHYLRKHDNRDGHNRIVLHGVAHKKDYDSNGTALVAVHKMQSLERRLVGHVVDHITHTDGLTQNRNFDVVVRGHKIPMLFTRKTINEARNGLKQDGFLKTLHNIQPTFRFNLGREQFEWRDATHYCTETRGIQDKGSAPLRTGQPRPKEKKFTRDGKGWILVRLTGIRGNPNTLGFTEKGDEIVLSFARDRWGYKTKIIFQWWNSGATGQLGADFAHVAAATGTAIWQDEVMEEAKKQAAKKK